MIWCSAHNMYLMCLYLPTVPTYLTREFLAGERAVPESFSIRTAPCDLGLLPGMECDEKFFGT
jgi:hypothetical protein